MKCIRFLLFGLSLSVFISNSQADEKNLASIAAVVNDQIVSLADLNERIKFVILSSNLPNTPDMNRQLAQQILQGMIDECLQIQEAKKYNIEIDDDDIKLAISNIEERNGMPLGALEKFFNSHGISKTTLEHQIRADISWQRLMRGRYSDLLQIGEDDINNAWQKIEDHKNKPHDLLSEIYLPVNSFLEEDRANAQVWQLTELLRQGANFEAVSRQFSQSASAAQGGDIGWIATGNLDSSLNDVIAELTLGGISDPIRTRTGYYIIKLRDHKETSPETAGDTIVSFIQIAFALPSFATQEQIENVARHAASVGRSAKSCKLLKDLVGTSSRVKVKITKNKKVKQIFPQIRDIITSLDIGKASQPIPSEIGILVFMVCDRKDLPPNEINREQVANNISRETLARISDREQRNLRRRSFVSTRG